MSGKKFATSINDFDGYHLRRKEFYVEPLELWIYLQELPAAKINLLRDIGEGNDDEASIKVVQATAVNAEGQPLFAGKNGESVLRNLSVALLQKMFIEALAVAPITDAEVAAEKKA